MDEIAALLAQMRELEPWVHVYGPAAENVISELEVVFGRTMPPSYRAFLVRFGGFSILDSAYSGIIGKIEQGQGWAWTDTKCARERRQLPAHYPVVQPDEDGFKCRDFSRTGADGEHPVVYHMPFRKTPFNEMAPSYGVWLTEDLRAMVEAWTDGAEPDAAPD